MPGGVPLKQYELTLQNAQRVLASLLEQPAKPWVPFSALLQELSEQISQLRRSSAASTLQRAWRGFGGTRHRPRGGAGGPCKTWRPGSFKSCSGGYACEEAPKKILIPMRPPMPPPSGTALNPLEKRRQMVAAQLAISNPSRLARSRRRAPSDFTPSSMVSSEGTSTIQEDETVERLPKLQPLAAACTVGRNARGIEVEIVGAAPLELLLKDELIEEVPNCADQLNLMGQCDSAGISMAPPPDRGAQRPAEPPFVRKGEVKQERPTPPSTAPTAEFYSTSGSLTLDDTTRVTACDRK
ncbi:unnamed protein product [Durusdinium trenchii]|uniref:Uncharacterized protein n=1 Tax=Durusdinium trenchii TaxID=1381693 RepID=A0ABP0I762_9DINO